MDSTKTRLAIAGRIAAGMAANPQNMAMRDWENEVARAAWNVAGKLLNIAAQYEADREPANVAANAAAYSKARG